MELTPKFPTTIQCNTKASYSVKEQRYKRNRTTPYDVSRHAYIGDTHDQTAIQHYMQTKRQEGYKHEDAKKFHEKAKETAKQDKEYCINQANICWNTGDFEQAKNYYTEALDNAMKLGDKDCEGTSYLGLASVASKESNYKTARKWYKKALDISETKPTDTILKKKALVGLGSACFNLGKIQKAIAYIEMAQQFAGRETEDGMVLALH